MKWTYFVLSFVICLCGMAGMKTGKKFLTALAFLLFPIVLTTAFWFELSYSDILFGICVIGLGSLKAYRKAKK